MYLRPLNAGQVKRPVPCKHVAIATSPNGETGLLTVAWGGKAHPTACNSMPGFVWLVQHQSTQYIASKKRSKICGKLILTLHWPLSNFSKLQSNVTFEYGDPRSCDCPAQWSDWLSWSECANNPIIPGIFNIACCIARLASLCEVFSY